MSICQFVLSRFGPAFGWTAPGDSAEPRPRRGGAGRAAGLARLRNRLLAAIERHTRRQIELALGERIAELDRAVHKNRAVETRPHTRGDVK